MVKVIALVRRRDDISREEFLHRWQVEHPPFVRDLHGLRRYEQSPAIAHRNAWPYDGAAELWFDDVKSVAAAFKSSAADALREHEETFIGDLEWFLTEECVVQLDGDGV